MPTTPAWAAASPSPPSPWARATRAGCPVRGVHRGGARQRAAPHAMHSIELQHHSKGCCRQQPSAPRGICGSRGADTCPPPVWCTAGKAGRQIKGEYGFTVKVKVRR